MTLVLTLTLVFGMDGWRPWSVVLWSVTLTPWMDRWLMVWMDGSMVCDPDPVTPGWMDSHLTLTMVFGLDKWSVTCDPGLDG